MKNDREPQWMRISDRSEAHAALISLFVSLVNRTSLTFSWNPYRFKGKIKVKRIFVIVEFFNRASKTVLPTTTPRGVQIFPHWQTLLSLQLHRIQFQFFNLVTHL
mgnify:CR=1 FL=1